MKRNVYLVIILFFASFLAYGQSLDKYKKMIQGTWSIYTQSPTSESDTWDGPFSATIKIRNDSVWVDNMPYAGEWWDEKSIFIGVCLNHDEYTYGFMVTSVVNGVMQGNMMVSKEEDDGDKNNTVIVQYIAIKVEEKKETKNDGKKKRPNNK